MKSNQRERGKLGLQFMVITKRKRSMELPKMNFQLHSGHSSITLTLTLHSSHVTCDTQNYNAVQNGWETPEKNLTNWWSPVLTKLKLSLCSISPSPPNQCWLAIIHNNMDWQHGNIGSGGGGGGGRADYCMSSWACIFRIEAAVSQLVLHAIVVVTAGVFQMIQYTST